MTHLDSAPSDSLHLDSPRGRWVLAATVLGSGMAMLDATVVNLALPSIAEDLDASFSQLQWVVNGYTLSLAALILLGGSLGDRMGRRRIFVTGAVWFTVASVLCAAARSSGISDRLSRSSRRARRSWRASPGFRRARRGRCTRSSTRRGGPRAVAAVASARSFQCRARRRYLGSSADPGGPETTDR